jgi:hypothetical protein
MCGDVVELMSKSFGWGILIFLHTTQNWLENACMWLSRGVNNRQKPKIFFLLVLSYLYCSTSIVDETAQKKALKFDSSREIVEIEENFDMKPWS